MKRKAVSEEIQRVNEFVFYQTGDGTTRIEVRFEGETVWLTQKQMSVLFQKDVRTINEHIQNIIEERELSADSVIRKFRITASDGKNSRCEGDQPKDKARLTSVFPN
jgi:hypothetical protein